MANKIITDLTLIGAVTDGISIPTDNGSQTYRLTALQMKNYILANEAVLLAALKNDIFTGLTAVAPAEDDYIVGIDSSDSNKTKKLLISLIKNATYRSVVTTDSVTLNDETMKLSGASFNSTLPTAVGIAGKRYKYIHAGTSLSQVYTLATTSGQTIGGVASGAYSLYTNGEVLEIESDGANWIIINHFANSYLGTLTTTGTWVTNTTYTGQYWREGDKLRGKVTVICSGAPTAVPLQLTFPGSLQLAIAKTNQPNATNNITYLKLHGSARNSASQSYLLHARYGTATAIGVWSAVLAGSDVISNTVNATAPFTFGSADGVEVEYEVPIDGFQP